MPSGITSFVYFGQKNKKWRIEEIYGKKTVGKFNVEGLFLQMIASRMLELKRCNDHVSWILGRTPDPNDPRETILNYEIETNWEHWNLKQ